MSFNVSFQEIPSQASPQEVEELTRLARRTFRSAFTHYKESDLNAYLDQALCEPTLRDELADLTNRFVYVVVNGQRAGYLKWQTPTARYQEHVHLPAERPFLLERFYFLEEFQGRGIAPIALWYCLSFAKHQAAADLVYLSVWEGNYRAQRFYQKHGFRTLGAFHYPVGEQLDQEFLYGLSI